MLVWVNVDFCVSSRPPGFLTGPWIQVDGGRISGADIAAWPYSVGIVIRFTSFLYTLHGPPGSDDFGHFWSFFFGASYLFSNGLVTGCSVKRLLGQILGLTVPF